MVADRKRAARNHRIFGGISAGIGGVLLVVGRKKRQGVLQGAGISLLCSGLVDLAYGLFS